MDDAGPNPLPLVMRQLRVAGRRSATYQWRVLCGAAGMGFAVWAFLVWGAAGDSGRSIFLVIYVAAALLAMLGGMIAAADAISRERREGTLGLLFLTDLGAADVILGKFAAAILLPLSMLLALWPALAVTQLVGGVPGGEIFRATLALALTLAYSAAVSVFCSCHCHQQRTALALSAIALLIFSPLWLCAFTTQSAYSRAPELFWSFLAASALLLPAMLAAAAWRLGRSWRQAIDYASGEPGPTLAATSLRGDPVSWMMSRRKSSRRTVAISWAFAAGVTIATVWAIGPARWSLSLALLFVLHMAWLLVTLSRTAHAFQQDREEGSLELLLGTRLEVSEIFWGFNRHLQAQNKAVLLTFAALDLLHAALFTAWGLRAWAAVPVAMGAVLWISVLGLGWTGVYRALLTDHPPLAMSAAFNRLALFPMFISGILILGSPGVIEGSVFWVVSSGFVALFFGMDASSSLRKHGRELLLRPCKDPLPNIENEWSFIDWDDLKETEKARA